MTIPKQKTDNLIVIFRLFKNRTFLPSFLICLIREVIVNMQ